MGSDYFGSAHLYAKRMNWRAILRSLLAVFFVAAGANHFRDPAFYLAGMPSRLPWHQPLIDLSGGAEIHGAPQGAAAKAQCKKMGAVGAAAAPSRTCRMDLVDGCGEAAAKLVRVTGQFVSEPEARTNRYPVLSTVSMYRGLCESS